ncbi:hypothetical protein V8C44DRAFT_178752 [Trichoderma aethiopicum]
MVSKATASPWKKSAFNLFYCFSIQKQGKLYMDGYNGGDERYPVKCGKQFEGFYQRWEGVWRLFFVSIYCTIRTRLISVAPLTFLFLHHFTLFFSLLLLALPRRPTEPHPLGYPLCP